MLKVHFHSLGTDTLASHRLRVKLIHDMIKLNHPDLLPTISPGFVEGADVVIFNKHFDPEGMSQIVFKNKKAKVKMIYDICDDHFDKPMGRFYEWMCNQVDKITCPTPAMQERIYQVTGKLAQIIPDAVTFPRKAARQTEPHTCLWFGHGTNLIPLEQSGWIGYLSSKGIPLTVVSNIEFNRPGVNFKKWEPNLVESIIGDYDTVILPTLRDSRYKVKSMNRAIDAINAGCHVITNGKKVYSELRPFITITDSLDSTTLGNSTVDLETVKQKIRDGQNYIETKYTPALVTELWVKVLKQVYKDTGHE